MPFTTIGWVRRSACGRRPRAVEKTRAAPAWKTLRVSHFPTASTAAVLNLKVLCSKPKTPRKSHYAWTKDGGQVTIQLTTANVFQYILKLKQLFDDNEVPLEDRKLVLPPVVETLIPRATNIALQTDGAYQELIKKGFINTISGFDIYSSARLTGDNVNGFHALAIQRNWQTFADKVLESEIEETLIGNFGAAYKGLVRLWQQSEGQPPQIRVRIVLLRLNIATLKGPHNSGPEEHSVKGRSIN